MRSVGALQDTPPCLTATAASVLLALSAAAAPAHAQETFPFPSPDELEPYTHPQQLVEIAPGRRVFVIARKGADGALTANGVVVGAEGVRPPM